MVTINHHRPVRQVSEVLCFLTNFWWWLGAVVGTQLSSGRYKSQSLARDLDERNNLLIECCVGTTKWWQRYLVVIVGSTVSPVFACWSHVAGYLKISFIYFLYNLNWNIQIWFWFLLCLKLFNIHSCGDKVLLVEIYSHTSIMLLLDWFGNPWITDLANASFRLLGSQVTLSPLFTLF